MTFDPLDPIGSVFAGVIGRPAWNVRKGHGSFLTFEFGNPHLEIREPIPNLPEASPATEALNFRRVTVSGEWHLWIYCCHWQATLEKDLIAHSGSPASEIDAAAAMLDGQKLVSAEADASKGTSRFLFDLGGTLKTVPYEGDGNWNWMFFTPEGMVLTYRGDGQYCWQSGDTPGGKEVWLPLSPSARLN